MKKKPQLKLRILSVATQLREEYYLPGGRFSSSNQSYF